jgi:hypothetical protein
VDQESIERLIDQVLPGSGNIRDGAARLLPNGYWRIPFKRGGWKFEAPLQDREIDSPQDEQLAISDIRSAIGLVIFQSQ